MVIWNALEDLRRRENARRGYVEVKTPLIFDNSLWETSGHWEKFRENMFIFEAEGRTFGHQADELSGPLPASIGDRRLELPGSAACAWPRPERSTATRPRECCTGCCEFAPCTRTTHTSSACPSRSTGEVSRLPRLSDAFSLGAFGFEPELRALDPARDKKLGSRRGLGSGRDGARRGARRARAELRAEPRRRRLLRAQDRRAHPRLARPRLADLGPSSSTSRCRSASVSPTSAPTTPSTRR